MDMNPWERRQKILEALCLRRYETTGNLAHEFNVRETLIKAGKIQPKTEKGDKYQE